ncbi:hypothetical protein [Salinispora sp. H7-4]|uniref:hypothetical protein n=1 Tax=Salinispora sp. H7-4 TaxID=2748321 RepID=UPI0015D1A239|nr:hypothetical protein [Salinispora sp. H7-4]NYT93681.1 hypothetical protein [Salinispora sp. H7-4]
MLSYLHPRISAYALVGLVLPMAFLSGCGEDAPGRTVKGNGVITFVAPEADGVRDALIIGELVVSKGQCLAVRTAENQTLVVVWPAGSELKTGGGTTGVEVPGAGTVKVGSTFTAGGGYVTPPLGDDMPSIPETCASGTDQVAVIDNLNRR